MRTAERTVPNAGGHTAGHIASPCAACTVKHLSLCAPLEGEALQSLEAIVTHVTVPAHATVMAEGDPADTLFNVTAGTVKLYKLLPDGRRQVTGFMVEGDFLGLAGGTENTYVYSAEAVTTVALCRFPRRKLQTLLEEQPQLERRLLGIASHELASAQDQMLLLGRKTAKERVASFLLAHANRLHKRGRPDNPLPLPMSRSDIADYLGLTTETVSRTMTQLKQSGVIRLLDGGRVDLTDRMALAALAEGA